MSAAHVFPQIIRVTFQTHSMLNINTSTNTTQSSSSPENRDIELCREEVCENNPSQLFTKSFLAVLTSKDAVLKEIQDCVLQEDEARCKEAIPYIHSFWKDLDVKSGWLFVSTNASQFPTQLKKP